MTPEHWSIFLYRIGWCLVAGAVLYLTWCYGYYLGARDKHSEWMERRRAELRRATRDVPREPWRGELERELDVVRLMRAAQKEGGDR